MSNSVNGKDWDPEGIADFTDFPIDRSEVKQDDIRWPITWMDEDEGQDFKDQLKKEQEQQATTITIMQAKPETPKISENYSSKLMWTDADELLELRKVMEMVKKVIELKTDSADSTKVPYDVANNISSDS